MTDQADTGPIGARENEIANEARIMGTRDGIDALAGSIGRSLAASEARTAALADEVRALRAENAELRAAYRDVENHWAARSGEASQYANALRKARTELAAARDREAALRSALERTQANFIDAVQGNPVRGMAENLAENAAALGASVQSEQPTKGASE